MDTKTTVQNTSKAGGISGPMPDPALTTLSTGATLGQIVNNPSKTDLKEAYVYADKVYDIQFGSGGIEELEGKLKDKKESVGETMYKILVLAYKHCEGKLLIVRPYFRVLVDAAEEHIVSKHIEASRKAGAADERPIGQLIPSWSVYKSTISKGLELGIDPDTRREGTDSLLYPTAAKYRKAVDEKVKATASGGTGAQTGSDRKSDKEVATVTALQTKGWSPSLAAAMTVMCQGLNMLTVADQDRFAPALLEISSEVAELVGQRKAEAEAAAKARKETESVAPVAAEGTPADTGEDLDAGTRAAMQKALDAETDGKAAEPTKRNSKRRGARAA